MFGVHFVGGHGLRFDLVLLLSEKDPDSTFLHSHALGVNLNTI